MIYQLHGREVEITKWGVAAYPEDTFIMSAYFIDDGTALSDAEMDEIQELYPESLEEAFFEAKLIQAET